MKEKRRFYKSESITVSFEAGKCIHAAECANGLPEVFNPSNRPWVNTEAADNDKIVEVVERCPSGALKYERHDGGKDEVPVQEAEITVIPNGPLYVRGELEIIDKNGEVIGKENRAALCRCGHSKNKPFCDNSHIKENFHAE